MIEDTLTVELPDGRTISVPPVPDMPGCAGSGDGWEALQLIVRSLADQTYCTSKGLPLHEQASLFRNDKMSACRWW